MDRLKSEQRAHPQPAATPERSIISGDNLQFGRMRRHPRLSHSENQTSGPEEYLGSSAEAGGSHGRSPGAHAEIFKPRSFSPRSPRGHWVKRPHQDAAQIPTVKSSGTPHRRYGGGRYRTSSETDKGGRGGREPKSWRKGLSEGDTSANMSGLQCLAAEKVWFDKHRFDEAERKFYEAANGHAPKQQQSSSHSGEQEMVARMKTLEVENKTLHKVVGDMRAALQKLEARVAQLEKTPKTPVPAATPAVKAAPVQAAPAKQVEENGDDDDDVDLFGSDDDDDEAARLKQERVEAYAAKKAKKPTVIAKSSILLDVKPWDDETDMTKLEECVRSVQMDGLLWGASKLVPVGYGIKKLQINCVVEDDKVGTDILEEEITKFEDFVQSVDVAAFNKI
ncbi:eukaryotic translation elongation factor 1 delta a (guanine nucleotide exchange protein) isoform X2 [Syngnathoides biaculeatus]|uniref:eukaryotic translation elongation factor 1 delta a (guanine nucleotide exchange protein) isoform X2 n=2 Tax=Syngnathoides biaculeatus TaxID=300417 RepID=UPI002ADE3FE0|nr:eukaryotic translation elongation factor 1 delta a (guanine nucleotide exchange protein) isoform X2 [Syngnathoides biaculeatus]